MIDQFEQLWTEVGAKGDPRPVYVMLEQCYAGRHYHTLEHVKWGLKRLDEIIENRDHPSPGALKWAMWFHDAVMRFDRTFGLDEEDSAILAVREANYAGLSQSFILDVRALILATDHKEEPGPFLAPLVDADLSILGASEQAFAEYERLIRLEWAHVDDRTFDAGRLAVLERFKDKRRIFHTPYAYHSWERKARFNLGQSIARLLARV